MITTPKLPKPNVWTSPTVEHLEALRRAASMTDGPLVHAELARWEAAVRNEAPIPTRSLPIDWETAATTDVNVLLRSRLITNAEAVRLAEGAGAMDRWRMEARARCGDQGAQTALEAVAAFNAAERGSGSGVEARFVAGGVIVTGPQARGRVRLAGVRVTEDPDQVRGGFKGAAERGRAWAAGPRNAPSDPRRWPDKDARALWQVRQLAAATTNPRHRELARAWEAAARGEAPIPMHRRPRIDWATVSQADAEAMNGAQMFVGTDWYDRSAETNVHARWRWEAKAAEGDEVAGAHAKGLSAFVKVTDATKAGRVRMTKSVAVIYAHDKAANAWVNVHNVRLDDEDPETVRASWMRGLDRVNATVERLARQAA